MYTYLIANSLALRGDRSGPGPSEQLGETEKSLDPVAFPRVRSTTLPEVSIFQSRKKVRNFDIFPIFKRLYL